MTHAKGHAEHPQRGEARYQTIVEQAPTAIVVMERDGRIALVNRQAEALFGYPRAALLGQPVEILLPEGSSKAAYAAATHVDSMGSDLRLFGQRRDGAMFPVVVSVNPLDDNAVIATVRAVNERLDAFAATVAHELRHPVTVTKLRMQVAQRRVLQAAAQIRGVTAKQTLPFIEVGKALAAAEGDLDQLLRIMQQLLDVTQARQGTLALDLQPYDLIAIVRGAVEEQRLLTPGRAISLELPDVADPASDKPVTLVEADVDRIWQVVSSYLSNAARYSPIDRPIMVSVRVESGKGNRDSAPVVRVEVQDSGPGIAPEEQAIIWEQLQQASGARQAQGGLGIGLYMASTVVKLHGGQVGVDSKLGQGSTFWFTLPLARPAA
jgi:PAS domain S-box-containing protein